MVAKKYNFQHPKYGKKSVLLTAAIHRGITQFDNNSDNAETTLKTLLRTRKITNIQKKDYTTEINRIRKEVILHLCRIYKATSKGTVVSQDTTLVYPVAFSILNNDLTDLRSE